MRNTCVNPKSTRILFLLIAYLISSGIAAAPWERVIIIHLQGNKIEAGFAGESSPRVSMPAVVGTGGSSGPMIGMQSARTYYGQDALDRSGLKLTYAVQNQRIVDFTAFKKLAAHILSSKLGIDSTEAAVVMNEASGSPDSVRKQTTQLFFEGLGVQGFFMSYQFQGFAQMSSMASQSTFVETFITQDEYDEIGASVILRKSP